MPSTAVPIVLLHGLGRTSRSMRRLARALESCGHRTVNLDYPSRREDIRACANGLLPSVLDFQVKTEGQVAFVGHSMGGLVARVLACDPAVRARCLVMIGSPNRGSEVADFVDRFRIGRLALGPALGELRTTHADAIPRPACPVGVIAGTRSYMPFTSRLMPGANDGLVSLDRSRLDGAEWMSLDAGHTFLMDHPDVPDAATTFFETGRFPAGTKARTPSLAIS